MNHDTSSDVGRTYQPNSCPSIEVSSWDQWVWSMFAVVEQRQRTLTRSRL